MRQLTHRGCCKGLLRIGAVTKKSRRLREGAGWSGEVATLARIRPNLVTEEKYVFMGGLNFTFFIQLFMCSLFSDFRLDESCC